jgi:hypothetical protein
MGCGHTVHEIGLPLLRGSIIPAVQVIKARMWDRERETSGLGQKNAPTLLRYFYTEQGGIGRYMITNGADIRYKYMIVKGNALLLKGAGSCENRLISPG